MTATTDTTAPRLKVRYREEISPALREEFSFPNIMQVPGLTKIVVNMGVGDAARDSKLIEGAIRDLTEITGQKPQVTKARKSIAQFKLREGMPIGARVTHSGNASRAQKSSRLKSPVCNTRPHAPSIKNIALPGQCPASITVTVIVVDGVKRIACVSPHSNAVTYLDNVGMRATSNSRVIFVA